MLLQSLPEYHLFETNEQRARGIEELDNELEKSKGFWRAMIIIWIALIIVANLSTCLIPIFLPWAIPGRVPIAIAIQVLLALVITLWVWRRGIEKRLREKLIQQGVPVCRGCGYCLRGLPAAGAVHCPECGREEDADLVKLLEQGTTP